VAYEYTTPTGLPPSSILPLSVRSEQSQKEVLAPPLALPCPKPLNTNITPSPKGQKPLITDY